MPEGLKARRIMALELSDAEHDMRAATPLGVCLALGFILIIEHQAAERYERLHRRMIERARPPNGCLANLVPSGEGSIALPDTDSASEEIAYLGYREAAKRPGNRGYHLVQDIVIHQHWPRFLDAERRRPPEAWLSDAVDLAAFRSSLGSLASAMNLRSERGDDFSDLIRGLERDLDRRPSDVEIAEAITRFSTVSLLARREMRLKREAAEHPR